MAITSSPALVRLAELRFVSIPEDVLEEARCVFQHNFIVALAGRGLEIPGVSQEPWPPNLPRELSATRLVDGMVIPAERAVFQNSLLMGARAQHDESPGAVSHFGSAVIPAVLAGAEQKGSSGRDILAALVVGYEVGDRIGRALVRETTLRGFRPTGLFGPIAAAAAVATLWELDDQEWISAVALASNMSAGLSETWRAGTDEWKYQTALAARSGYTAAVLAEAGASGSPDTFEAPQGFQQAFTGSLSMSIDTQKDSIWAMSLVNLKLYPVCVFNQSAVQQVIDLRDNVLGSTVRSIDVRMNPRDADYPGVDVQEPRGTRAARLMSLPVSLAIAITRGRVDVADLEGPVSTKVRGLARTVKIYRDESVPSHTAHVTINTSEGGFALDAPRGLLSDESRTEDVYCSLRPHTGLSVASFDELMHSLRQLRTMENVRKLLSSLRRGSG